MCCSLRRPSFSGRKYTFQIPLSITFDADDRLAGERIHYDRGALLGQIGLFHEPVRGLGRVITALTYPITISRVYLRRSPRAAIESGPPHVP